MGEEENVLVIGAGSFVGQHVVKELQLAPEGIALIRTYDLHTPFEKTLADFGEYKDSVPVESESGELGSLSSLHKALVGTTTVINCLDYQDFAMVPDKARIDAICRRFVVDLAQAADGESSVKRVIHTSSLTVGASWLAPTVYPTEKANEPLPKPSRSLFPDYVTAKQYAENVWRDYRESSMKRVIHTSSLTVGASWLAPTVYPTKKAKEPLPKPSRSLFPDYITAKQYAENVWRDYPNLQVFILRLPFLYGEGDEESIIMDLLRYANNHSGTAYIPASTLGKFHHSYVGNIGHGYVCALRKMRSEANTAKEIFNLVDETPWGFWVSPRLARMPSADLLYAHFTHWHFWNNMKARLYLNYIPKYTHEESMALSVDYYRNVPLQPIK